MVHFWFVAITYAVLSRVVHDNTLETPYIEHIQKTIQKIDIISCDQVVIAQWSAHRLAI